MLTSLILASLAAAVLFCVAVVAVVGFLLKIVFWAIFFPVRLALKLVFGVLGAGLGLVFVPLLLLVGATALAGALLAALFALLAPLLPVALLALVGWTIYRASTRVPLRSSSL